MRPYRIGRAPIEASSLFERLRFEDVGPDRGGSDIAVAESFFRTLKTELGYDLDLFDEHHAQKELFEYIEVFYNRQRLHATLGYVPPAEYEAVKLRKCA